MTTSRATPAAALLAAFAACTVGPSPATYGPAHSPAGATCTADRGREPAVRGELLLIQDTAALLLARIGTQDRIVAVPFRGTRGLSCPDGGFVQFTRTGAFRDTVALPTIRRLSRFPYGLTPDAMSALLTSYSQTQPDPPPVRSR